MKTSLGFPALDALNEPPLLSKWTDEEVALEFEGLTRFVGIRLPTAASVLASARSEVGYREKPVNLTKFAGVAQHPNGFAWCATFISALMVAHGVMPKRSAVLTPSSRTMYGEARNRGLSVPLQKLQPGDVVHMKRGKPTQWFGHVGLVVSVKRRFGVAVSVTTIEGNTNGAGSATGGAVVMHTRLVTAWNLGAWSPPYKVSK